MQKRTFGKTGLQVSVLGFGGVEIGFEKDITVQRVKDILLPALELGLNVVDTACAYLASEQLIGQALEGRRKDVLLFTKCGAQDGFQSSDWSRKGIFAQCEGSLKALKTDVLDLLQLHSCSAEELAKGEAIQALKDLKQQGKIRFMGYSGDSSAAVAAVESGQFDTLQTSFSVVDQEAAHLTLPLAMKREMGIIFKRSVANVAFRHGVEGPPNAYHRSYFERFQAMNLPQFSADNLTDATETLLRFSVHHPAVHVALVGTSNAKRFEQNWKTAAKGDLVKADRDALVKRFEEVGSKWPGQV